MKATALNDQRGRKSGIGHKPQLEKVARDRETQAANLLVVFLVRQK